MAELGAAASTHDASAAIRARVEARVAEVLGEERRRWRALDPALDEPLASLEAFVLAGGKRLRPLFCHWGHVAAGGDPDEPAVVDAGAAFELLHAFALVHDDVMDGSATRRARPTLHSEYEARHDGAGWRGERRRFGEGVAILVGDLGAVYAERLLRGAPDEALDVWHELQIEINIGQYLDLLGTVRGGAELAVARRISRYKSGKYTIERPLHLGAALASRYAELAAPLSAYGDPLGEAFQLRDDLLGAFGDPAATGKPVGDDLREGKPTPLLALARRRADAEQRRLLDRVGRPDLDSGDVEALQAVLVATGAVDAVEASIAELRDEALEALAAAGFPPEAEHALARLAVQVTRRAT